MIQANLSGHDNFSFFFLVVNIMFRMRMGGKILVRTTTSDID